MVGIRRVGFREGLVVGIREVGVGVGLAVVGSGVVAVGGSGVVAVGPETIPTELHPHKSLTTVARIAQFWLIKAVLPARPAASNLAHVAFG